MAYFIRDTGNALTPLQHSMEIFKQYILQNYFSTMIGKRGSGKPIIIDDKLFKGKGAGDVGRYHFIPQYTDDDAIEGQNASIDGNEKTLDEFYMDLRIDQIAQAFKKKGKMTDKRTIWDCRSEFKGQLENWFKFRTELDIARALTGFITDGVTRLTLAEQMTTPLVNGAGRCVRTDAAGDKFVEVTAANSTGNALLAAMDATDVMNTAILDNLQYFAKNAGKYPMKPVRVSNGEEYYILVLHTKAAVALRQDARWVARALAALTGSGLNLEKDPIATGAIGIWEKIIVKEAERVITQENAAGTVKIARNLLLGADACVMAYGQTLDYTEELKDHKRVMTSAADEIRGVKKLAFDGNDMNVMQVVTAI